MPTVPVLGTTAEKLRAYYAAFGDKQQTRLLVPATSTESSVFDTNELKDMWLFALSAGGKGLSQKTRADYNQTTVCAERAALRGQHGAEATALGKVLGELSEDQGGASDDYIPGGPPCVPPMAGGPHHSASTANSSAREVPVRPRKNTSLR